MTDTPEVEKNHESILGQCALCDHEDIELKKSHIIPKFVFDWIKNTSKTNYLRKNDDINVRRQDGDKEYLLCDLCEQKLSILEMELAQKLFKKIANYRQQAKQIEVTESIKVAILSIFWRALLTTKNDNNFTAEDNVKLNEFLVRAKFDINNNQCNEKIYIVPFFGESPYYGLKKELTYYLERNVVVVDSRFFDKPHRYYFIFKLPFMFFYIFSEGWTSCEISNSTELIIGQLQVDEIYSIPEFISDYIEYSYSSSKNSLTQMTTKNREKIRKDAERNNNITGSDKSMNRSE